MCDTFVVLPPFTSDGSVIFGKNSDREPNEAQLLEVHPARTHRTGQTLRCTYLEIPQASETRAVLLCRPFWMWGAEMGANEKGLVIGNQAVFTRMPLNREGGLTGMDLLRLALERADAAEQAVETMVRLLADYGQGGICGYENKRMAYHNSFLLADPKEAWVLETAGPLWATKRVEGFASLSNGLTIGEEFDACHPDAVQTAKEKGWLKRAEPFDFARCFSDWFYTTFSACCARQARSLGLIRSIAVEGGKSGADVPSALHILRDHDREPYHPDTHFLGNRICAHAANRVARNATQTTGSLVAHLETHLQTYWATGTSAPCTGVFKPIWFNEHALPDAGAVPGKAFHPESVWWHHEKLHRSVLKDYAARLEAYREDRDALEGEFLEEAGHVRPAPPSDLTRRAFTLAREATTRWTEQVRDLPIYRRAKWTYRQYWKHQNLKAGLDV